VKKNGIDRIIYLLKLWRSLMSWYEHLESNGFVQIDNFLPLDEANNLRKQIVVGSHFKTWNILTTPYRPLANIKDQISTDVIDRCRHQQALKARKRKQFSFSFYRSSNKHQQQHKQADIHQRFGQKVAKLLAKSTQAKGQLVDTFFAAFRRDQFIAYHTDGSAGKYAFIYQLSKGWQPKFGGQLVLYPNQIKFFKKTIEPKFNSLMILKLAYPMPHSVNQLTNPEHKHRITISGWVE
jgi:Rps23 Pro-64 3,4-dihydroxylase Tpa1-like proline 4-hydroxylase